MTPQEAKEGLFFLAKMPFRPTTTPLELSQVLAECERNVHDPYYRKFMEDAVIVLRKAGWMD